MSKHFFSGGTMPSDRLFCFFLKGMYLKGQWRVNGTATTLLHFKPQPEPFVSLDPPNDPSCLTKSSPADVKQNAEECAAVSGGQHYARTCEDWLAKLDRNYHLAAPILVWQSTVTPAEPQLHPSFTLA
jgi:hypothetical protein